MFDPADRRKQILYLSLIHISDDAEDIAGFDVDVYILTGKEFSFTVSSIVFLRYVF